MKSVVCLVIIGFFGLASCRSLPSSAAKVKMPAWTIAPGQAPKNYFVTSNLLPSYAKINVADLNLNLQVVEETASMSGEYLKTDLNNIDCSFYASSGTLFGKIRYPPLLNATIIKNQIALKFSESQFNDFNSPAEYHENPTLKSSLKVEPAEAKVFRISHFCVGHGTGFMRASQKGAGYLIFFADRPLKLTGEIDFGNDEKGIVDIVITEPGFNFISMTKANRIYHFNFTKEHDAIAFVLWKDRKKDELLQKNQ